eukprot:5635467-Pyramimonas_sp.AAC.1
MLELSTSHQQCESLMSLVGEMESKQQATAEQLEAAVSECEALSTKMAEQQAQADQSLQVVTAE